MRFGTIRQKVVLDAPPEDVYDAYVDPKKHSEFTGSPARGTPKVGGGFTAWDGYISGSYLEMDRGKRLVHEWWTTEWPTGYPHSIVELTFTRKGRGTELSMVQSKVPYEQADEYESGWTDYYWEPLKKHFGGRR